MLGYKRLASVIAKDLGGATDLLNEAHWELEPYDSYEGLNSGYTIRFSRDTPRTLLDQLGVQGDQFDRVIGVASLADSSDGQDDGIYPLDQPLPDLFPFSPDSFDSEDEVEKGEVVDRRAYYIANGRYTPSQFRRLSKARMIDAMVHWFHENYEDPAVRLPFESREGGYQWIWGGPYDAGTQISNEFSDIADEDSINAATREVTQDGLYEWAPKAWREQELIEERAKSKILNRRRIRNGRVRAIQDARLPNPVRDQNDSADGKSLEKLSEQMLERLKVLETLVRKSVNISPKRGHNNPPELLICEQFMSLQHCQEVVTAIGEIRRESEAAAPNLENIVDQVSVFRRIASVFSKGTLWTGAAAAAGVIGQEASLVYSAHKTEVLEALMGAVEVVSAWVQLLQSVF